MSVRAGIGSERRIIGCLIGNKIGIIREFADADDISFAEIKFTARVRCSYRAFCDEMS